MIGSIIDQAERLDSIAMPVKYVWASESCAGIMQMLSCSGIHCKPTVLHNHMLNARQRGVHHVLCTPDKHNEDAACV